MKKLTIAVLIVALCLALAGCASVAHGKNGLDNEDFVTDLPTLNKDGWYEVFTQNFGAEGDAEIPFSTWEQTEASGGYWTTSPHAMRWETNKKGEDNMTSYWCPDTVKVKNGMVEISSYETTTHKCSSGSCPSVGRFTGGIETRMITTDPNDNKGTADEILFSQAYGYFEARVKFPKAEGLWSAFWLQSSNQRKVGSEGVDGTEIDVYESAFIKNPTHMGNALLWDGYGKYAKVTDFIADTKQDLYEGFHTFALKWTPMYYVFYIDGNPFYATNGGGVAKVKEFLRLTVEMDAGDGFGPHGQKIGQFKDNGSTFFIDYVKVWQNSNYEQFIIDDSLFPGDLDFAN